MSFQYLQNVMSLKISLDNWHKCLAHVTVSVTRDTWAGGNHEGDDKENISKKSLSPDMPANNTFLAPPSALQTFKTNLRCSDDKPKVGIILAALKFPFHV